MEIRTIHFAYDVADLMEVDEELRKTTIAREYLEVFFLKKVSLCETMRNYVFNFLMAVA